MSRPIDLSIDIDRGPEEVWRFINDYANEKLWQKNVTELVVDPPGPAQKGTRVNKVRRTPVGSQRFTTEVMEVHPERLSQTDRVMNGSFAGTQGEWSLSGGANESRLRLRITPVAQGAWKIMLPFIARSMRSQMTHELKGLKAILETGANRR